MVDADGNVFLEMMVDMGAIEDAMQHGEMPTPEDLEAMGYEMLPDGTVVPAGQ